MSIQSRARQAARDLASGRSKPEHHEPMTVPPPPARFDVTAFQQQAHNGTLTTIPAKGQGKIRVKPPARPLKQLPAWQRDGFKSALHYEVDHKKTAFYRAFGDESHPLHKRALEAHSVGLLEGIK